MATIYDVAKAAGVSPKTVSRVLNGDAPVGKETRKIVEETIRKLGYVPSNAARSMRSNRSGLIGLITGAISLTKETGDPHGLPDLFIVQGIQKEMYDAGKTLMIADTGGYSDSVPGLIRTFLEHRVEGLIYVADRHMKINLDTEVEAVPLMLVNCFDDRGTSSVLPDDRALQRDLVTRLIQCGHKRIGFLTLDTLMEASVLRTKGYRDALSLAGISFDEDLVRIGYEEGKETDSTRLMNSLEKLLKLPKPPTVICCGNDEMALRVYGLLRTRGVKVPEEISIAGFDNYRAIAETLFPPLTTVELPYQAMGRVAARNLLAKIRGDASVEKGPVLVSGPVVWRTSVTALNTVSHLSNGRISK